MMYSKQHILRTGRFSVVVSSLVLSPQVAVGVEKPDDESVSESLSVCPNGVCIRGTCTGLKSDAETEKHRAKSPKV